jgi:hypothetical protein
MVSQLLAELTLEDLSEEGEPCADVHIQQTFVELAEVVLLIVPKCIDRPEKARLLLRQPESLGSDRDGLLKADRAAAALVEDTDLLLDQRRL